MVASIALTGLSAGFSLPGVYTQITFGAGKSAGFSGQRAILLLGNKSSSGSATADTVVYGPDTTTPLLTDADCISLYGEGSELHRMWRRAVAVNNATPIYALAVAASAGSDGYGTVTVSGTANTAGTVRVYLGDEFVDAGFAKGDSLSVIGDAIEAAVNSKSAWAADASNASGTVTLTAKTPGPRGNFIRYSARIVESGTGVSVTPTAQTSFSGGTTADDNTNALATLLAQKFYYIVSAANDATQLQALVDQVNAQALPLTGIRQRVFAASSDTLANSITLATGVNAPRAEIAWLAESDMTPSEMAAQYAAIVALEEASTLPRINFNGYGNSASTSGLWRIKAPLSGAKPTPAQMNSAILNGLSPIGVNQNGSTYLVGRFTTYTLNGSVSDDRCRHACQVTIPDFYCDDLEIIAAQAMENRQIGDDPADGADPAPPQVLTPSIFKTQVNSLTQRYGDLALCEKIAETKLSTIVIREANPSTRMSVQVPLVPSKPIDQIALSVLQVG